MSAERTPEARGIARIIPKSDEELRTAALTGLGGVSGLYAADTIINHLGLSGRLPPEDQASINELNSGINTLQRVETDSLLPGVSDAQINKQIDVKQAQIGQIEAQTPPGLPGEAQAGILIGAAALGGFAVYALKKRVSAWASRVQEERRLKTQQLSE